MAHLLTTTAKRNSSEIDSPSSQQADPRGPACFHFTVGLEMHPLRPVNRQNLRTYFRVALLLLTAFALWGWFRPYAWRPDPAARCEVAGVQVTRDASYCWVNIHLKIRDGLQHDLQKPVFLEIPGRPNLEPADTIFAGSQPHGTTDIWLKFWADSAQLSGPLTLRINDGSLRIKSGHGTPDFGGADSLHFTTHSW